MSSHEQLPSHILADEDTQEGIRFRTEKPLAEHSTALTTAQPYAELYCVEAVRIEAPMKREPGS